MSNAREAAYSLNDVRERNPLVHNSTNYVAMDVSANVLLALGAAPAMVHAVEEAAEFTRISAALVLNIGTLSPRWVDAMAASAAVARDREIPRILDPVGAGATAYRTKVATQLLDLGVDVVRGNASEIMALAGAATGPTRGVDSTDDTADAIAAARALASKFSCVVAVTGAVDYVTDGESAFSIRGGDPLMTRVTALGCAASAVIAAFAAVRADRLQSTAHALAVYGLAGTQAAARAEGPGSFRVAFLDRLSALTPEAVEAGVQIEG